MQNYTLNSSELEGLTISDENYSIQMTASDRGGLYIHRVNSVWDSNDNCVGDCITACYGPLDMDEQQLLMDTNLQKVHQNWAQTAEMIVDNQLGEYLHGDAEWAANVQWDLLADSIAFPTGVALVAR